MKVSLLSIAAALAALAQAVQFTNSQFDVQPNKPFTITYSGNEGKPVTILLKAGPSDDLHTVSTLTTSSSTGSFTWTPPASLPSDTYAFEIIGSDGIPNFSAQFPIKTGVQKHASSSTESATKSATATEESSSSTTKMTTTTSSSSPTHSFTVSPTMTMHSNDTSISSTGEVPAASSEPTDEPTTIPSTNAAGNFQSSLALVLGAVAALAFLN